MSGAPGGRASSRRTSYATASIWTVTHGHPIPAVSALAASHGIFVGVAALSNGDVDGAASSPRNLPPCMFVDEAAAKKRILSGRFAMAHELCHLLMDRSRAGDDAWVCSTSAREEGSVTLDVEKRANAFAAYLLAPRAAVLDEVRDLASLESAEFVAQALRIRERFGLTTTTAAEHLLNCHQEVDAAQPGRERLPSSVRNRLRDAVESAPIAGFEADQNLDAAVLGAPVPRTRRGRFAELLRRWVAVGELPPERAAALLGAEPTAIMHWLTSAG